MAIGPAAAAQLMSALSELLRSVRAIGQRSRDLGATGTALGVLKTLQHGDVRPGDLATALRVGPSVISRALVPLEQEGLVERRVDPVDGRATLIGITPLGHTRLAEVSRVYEQQLCQTLRSWTDAEVLQAADVLVRLHQALAGYHPPDTHRQALTEALLLRKEEPDPDPAVGPPQPATTDAPAAPSTSRPSRPGRTSPQSYARASRNENP